MAKKKTSLPPLEVSSLTKLARWSCLISGVIYSFLKRREYAALEKVLREKEAEKLAREIFLAREKIRLNTAEIKELEQIFFEMSSSNEEINLVNNNNRYA